MCTSFIIKHKSMKEKKMYLHKLIQIEIRVFGFKYLPLKKNEGTRQITN